MAGHKWMQSLRDTSVCPKCKKYSLQRSTAHNKFEDFKRHHSNKRPYRCHECNWRGWLKENALIYPSTKALMELRKGDFSQDSFKPIALDFKFDPDEDIPHYRGSSQDEQKQNSVDTGVSIPQPVDKVGEINEEVKMKPDKKSSEENTPVDFIFPQERKFADQLTSRSDRNHRGLGHTCPVCGETALHRSHSRGFIEYVKKKFSSKRPFRCNKCMWRGWLNKD